MSDQDQDEERMHGLQQLPDELLRLIALHLEDEQARVGLPWLVKQVRDSEFIKDR